MAYDEEYGLPKGPAGGGGAGGIVIGGGADSAAEEEVRDTAYYIGKNQDPQAWMDSLFHWLNTDLIAVGKTMGESPQVMTAFLSNNWERILNDINTNFLQTQMTGLDGQPIDGNVFLSTVPGLKAIFNRAKGQLQSQWSDLTNAWAALGTTSPGGGGGGGGMSAQDIRNQFDVEQLANAAQGTWRSLLLDEMEDPRGVARAYIEQVVKTGGKQKMDFETYVIQRAKNTARYSAIYKNKPASMSEAQFLMPYFNAAQQMVGSTDEAASLGIEGARVGASSAGFQARLARTDANTKSAPFISGMENRMRDVRKVFRE